MRKIIKAQWGSSIDPFYQLNNIEESSLYGTPFYSNLDWRNNLFKKSNKLNSSINIPLDFSAKTSKGALLPKSYYNMNSNIFGKSNIGNTQKNDFLSKNSGTIQDISNSLGTLPGKTNNSTTNTINAGIDTIGDTLGSIPNPYTQIASAGIKWKSLVGREVNKLIGMETPKTGVDKVLSSDLGMATGIGAINALTSTKVEGSDIGLSSLASQYGGAENVEGGSVGGVSKAWSWLTGKKNKAKQLQRSVDRANLSNLKKAAIVNQSNKNLTASSNSIQDVANKNYQKLVNNSGINILASKNGSKLELTKLKNKVQKKQKGGILEGVNLIPSGALHKELNHLSDKLPENIEITRKGIPVIQVEDGGKIQNQLAEIEASELTLHLKLTQKLEELKKQYDNGDETALKEAGRILTDEILYNTNDNTNLLKQVS